jgi:hypothetical protein
VDVAVVFVGAAPDYVEITPHHHRIGGGVDSLDKLPQELVRAAVVRRSVDQKE